MKLVDGDGVVKPEVAAIFDRLVGERVYRLADDGIVCASSRDRRIRRSFPDCSRSTIGKALRAYVAEYRGVWDVEDHFSNNVIKYWISKKPKPQEAALGDR